MAYLKLRCAILMLASLALGHQVQDRQSTSGNAQALIDQGLMALGGQDSISQLNSVSYVGETILRAKTLMLAISVDGLDRASITAGRQNVTFSFQEPDIKQRIDKIAYLEAGWTFARASLEPMDYSMLVQGGNEGFAAVVRGSYNVYDVNAEPSGYVDGLLASYLITEANKWNPLLLHTFLGSNKTSYRSEKNGAGVELPGIHDEATGLTILFDPETHLPHIIRSYEDHPFYGFSTNDLLVHNYTEVDGVQFPRRFRTIYNGKHIIGDYVADNVLTNPTLEASAFSGPSNGTMLESSIPRRDPEYSFAEIGETSANFLWPGAYAGTLQALEAAVTQPFGDVPGLWVLGMEMRQVVIELQDGSVIVLDAPPHQSKLVIDWAQQRLGKNVTHVWPSHHHHDHAFGVVDYAAIGAKIIAPEYAAHYYNTLNLTDGQILTYKRNEKLVFSDNQTQLAIVDIGATLHAEDHGYAFISPTCPNSNSSVGIFDADHANLAWINTVDLGLLQEFVDALARDRVTLDAHVFPSHGPDGGLAEYIGPSEFKYPVFSPPDFVHNQNVC